MEFSKLNVIEPSTTCPLTLDTKVLSIDIAIGTIKNCVMVYYYNPLNFFLQLCSENDELYDLMDEIKSIYDKNDKVRYFFKILWFPETRES